MIKLIIFDLDGVLINSRDLHYYALNDALQTIDDSFVISREEHLSLYDGKTTKTKLKLLTETKNLPEGSYNSVWKLKQQFTRDRLQSTKENVELKKLFKHLKDRNISICVASNAIRQTVLTSLEKIGVLIYCDYVFANEDVFLSKPNASVKCHAIASPSLSSSVASQIISAFFTSDFSSFTTFVFSSEITYFGLNPFSISIAIPPFLGRSRMCPILDLTVKPFPKYPSIVFAFAGDSTITKFLLIAQFIDF